MARGGDANVGVQGVNPLNACFVTKVSVSLDKLDQFGFRVRREVFTVNDPG